MSFDFPDFAGSQLLKLDFGILSILLGLVVLNLRGALSILPGLFSAQTSTEQPRSIPTLVWPMNIIAVAVFVIAFALIWKKRTDNRSFSDCFCGGEHWD